MFKTSLGSKRRLMALCTLAATAIACAACSSSSKTASTTSGTGTSSASGSASSAGAGTIPDTPTGYTGFESTLPHVIATPTLKPGTKFSVAFLGVQQSERSLANLSDSIKKQVQALGGTYIVYDAESNPDKQVSQFNEVLSQDVNAIVLQPANPAGLTTQLKQAAAKGIPVVSIATPPAADQPPLPGIKVNFTQGLNQSAYYDAKAIATAKPGAKFAVLGIGLPVPVLSYIAAQLKQAGIDAGLSFVTEVDAATPAPDAAAAAMTSILAKAPNVDAVMVLTDVNSLAASTVARQQGKHILFTSVNADPAGVAGVASGKLTATFDYNYQSIGISAANALYDLVTHQSGTLPPVVVPIGTPITKPNAAAYQKANGQ
jgi:ribose transport system substrate-binding protein